MFLEYHSDIFTGQVFYINNGQDYNKSIRNPKGVI